MIQIEELKQKLETESLNISIVSHQNPDGDAIGSALALYHLFKDSGHKAKVLLPNEGSDDLKILPGHDEAVLYFERNSDEAKKYVDESDIIFGIDFNDLYRAGDLGSYIEENSNCQKVHIDHHPNPGQFASYILSDTGASSTAELIYVFAERLGWENKITREIAECLYTGLVTDSGSFRFSSVGPNTHRVTAELLKTGFNHAELHQKVFDNYKENALRFLGYCLSEKLVILHEYQTAYIALSKKELDHYAIEKGQTEGLVNYALRLSNVKFSVLFKESGEYIKISLRSKGNFPVNEFSAEVFDGGGHRNAAGGRSDLTLAETLELFEKKVRELKKQLLES